MTALTLADAKVVGGEMPHYDVLAQRRDGGRDGDRKPFFPVANLRSYMGDNNRRGQYSRGRIFWRANVTSRTQHGRFLLFNR